MQAEDGIRDYKVTGVQTCALPISPTAAVCAAACSLGTSREASSSDAAAASARSSCRSRTRSNLASDDAVALRRRGDDRACSLETRSEERRVGKGRRRSGEEDHASRRRHTRLQGDWSSDVCSSDLADCRCVCGSLLARYVEGGVELRCRRCKRTFVVPLEDTEQPSE